MKRPQRITPSQSTSDKAAAAFRRGPGSAARPGTRASTQSGWRRSSTAFTTAAARRASFTRKTGVVAYLVALTAKSRRPAVTASARPAAATGCSTRASRRSEEHTSELQSLMRISYAVFCLKKKTNIRQQHHINYKHITPIIIQQG